jgi:hypothetical protein
MNVKKISNFGVYKNFEKIGKVSVEILKPWSIALVLTLVETSMEKFNFLKAAEIFQRFLVICAAFAILIAFRSIKNSMASKKQEINCKTNE